MKNIRTCLYIHTLSAILSQSMGIKTILIIVLGIIPFLCLSQEIDSVQFEPLKEYQGKAQPSLLKHLDFIFSTKKKIDLEVGVGNKLSFYQNYFFENRGWDWILTDTLDFSIPTDFQFSENKGFVFNPEYYYHMHSNNWDVQKMKEKIPPNTRGLFDFTVDSSEYLIFNFIIDQNTTWGYTDLYVVNSIVKDGLSAKYYKNSIIHEDNYRDDQSFHAWHEELERHEKELKEFGRKTNNINTSDDKLQNSKEINPFDPKGTKPLTIRDSYVQSLVLRNSEGLTFSKMSKVEIFNTKVNFLYLSHTPTENLYIDHDYTKDIFELDQDSTADLKSNYLDVMKCEFDECIIGNSWKRLFMKNSSAKSKIEIKKMQDTLIIVGSKDTKIDIYQERKRGDEKSKIFLWDINYDNLNTQWFGYELFRPHQTWTDDHLNSTYLSLLAHFKMKGFEESYEEVDKEYRKWKHLNHNQFFIDWLDENWWDYGYNKLLVLRNTFLIFLFFSFVNCWFLAKLSSDLYYDERVHSVVSKRSQKSRLKNFFVNIPAAVFYTSQIFFGIKFSYDKLKYADKLNGVRVFFLFYFFLMYLSGLICIAYIVNVVVTK